VTSIEDALRRYYDDTIYQRAGRPAVPEREQRRDAFAQECRERGIVTVLEVGCGAGRDGTCLVAAGLNYSGIDLSPNAVEMCRGLGLDAHEAQATSLPFGGATFDGAWSMSTLMHLHEDGMQTALAELRRVVRLGGLVEVGVWGDTRNRDWTGFTSTGVVYGVADAAVTGSLVAGRVGVT
jgi:SAM-dependent methyltransferase